MQPTFVTLLLLTSLLEWSSSTGCMYAVGATWTTTFTRLQTTPQTCLGCCFITASLVSGMKNARAFWKSTPGNLSSRNSRCNMLYTCHMSVVAVRLIEGQPLSSMFASGLRINSESPWSM